MFLIEMKEVIYRTGFTKDEIHDLINKEIFPEPYIIKPIEKWDIEKVEDFCIYNKIIRKVK